MTPQDIFNTAVIGVLKQGEPSIDLGIGKCLYRGEGGLKCAAGFLIDDELAKEGDVKGCSFHRLRHMFDEEVPEHLKENEELVSDLQSAHDGVSQPNIGSDTFIVRFWEKAKKIAAKHELDPTKAFLVYTKLRVDARIECLKKEKVSC